MISLGSSLPQKTKSVKVYTCAFWFPTQYIAGNTLWVVPQFVPQLRPYLAEGSCLMGWLTTLQPTTTVGPARLACGLLNTNRLAAYYSVVSLAMQFGHEWNHILNLSGHLIGYSCEVPLSIANTHALADMLT